MPEIYCSVSVQKCACYACRADNDDLAEEEEPSWELPPDLKDYLGDPSDRKGMLTWRQRQQSARQVLISLLFPPFAVHT